MAFAAPSLDHVVVDTRDRMDDAVSVYRALGFRLTERGRHSLGSINHLAIFDTDYLELLGVDPQANAPRPDIMPFPIGLNGLVFAADRPDALYEDLRSKGLPADEPQSFSRPVDLPEGSRDAKFRVVRLRTGSVSHGRVYFCHHVTPDLIWRPEWRQHPNGAESIARIVITTRDPAAASELFARMFGGEALRAGTAGTQTLTARRVRIDLVTPDELAQRFGDAAPDPAGRADYMAALSIRTTSLSQAAQAVRAGGVSRARIEKHRILVPAADAMNVAVEFVE